MPGNSGSRDPVRVCGACSSQLEPQQAELASQAANCHKTNHLADARIMLPPALRPSANQPFTMTLGSAIRNATYTLMQQMDPLLVPDQKIPSTLLRSAEGFLFLTFLRVSFLGGLRLGSGLAIVKREDGTWSAPSAVGIGGLSLGFMAGSDCVNLCLVLMSRQICGVLASQNQFSLGGEIGASIGPIGRNAAVGFNVGRGVAPVYSYSQSRGLFAGVDVNGSAIIARKSVNQKFYGVKHSVRDILQGNVDRPEACRPLYEILMQVTGPGDDHQITAGISFDSRGRPEEYDTFDSVRRN